MVLNTNLDIIIRKFALHNAILHNGKANSKAVLGKILAEQPELRVEIKELMSTVNVIINEINAKNELEIIKDLESLAPELLHKEKQQKILVLPDLPNIDRYKKVIMRFAPGPSGPLHIGHSRAIILNDEYIKRYSGKFIIRFEDTNPQNIEPKAYDLIPEDLAWLDVKYHKAHKQSERFEIYYKWAEELIKSEYAYVCTCDVETWRKLKENQKPCPDYTLPYSEHLERWQKMLDREYRPGEVSFVIKTDLTHPNPAVRDFVGMRIVAEKHPITDDNYYVYPTYNFSVAIDDHLMGITHILRGKDHLNNTYRQKYIYNYLGWSTPEFLHYGWVSLPNVILKTTAIKKGISNGKYTGWSDIQLGTLQALAQRGIQPMAIRKYWLDVGIKEVDIEFTWQTLYAFNKDLIDKEANRYFFVWNPVRLVLTDINELKGQAPLHPDDLNRGYRFYNLHANKGENGKNLEINLWVPQDDIKDLKIDTKLRLKDLCNIEIIKIDPKNGIRARYIGNDLSIIKTGVKIIHWVSESENYPMDIFLPDGEIKHGLCEISTINSLNKIIQFERFGFVRLGKSKKPPLTAWFTHK